MASESGSSGDAGLHSGNSRENQLVLLPESVPDDRSLEMPPAQRQRNLQDLLRLCTQVSGPNIGSAEPMDEQKRLFLEEALKSLTVDVIEVLLRSIKVLEEAGALGAEDDPNECETALEDIMDYVDHIDFANDFHKIGGLTVLHTCLNSPHAGVRWRAAQLVGELTQNNPYCQHHVLEAGLLPTLLSLLDSDPSQIVRIKALYALSSLVRSNKEALEAFQKHDGFSALLRALQSGAEKLQVKAAFFLSALRQPSVQEELLKMGFVEAFATLLSEDVSHATEHLLSALLALVEDCPAAQAECRRPQLQLHRHLLHLVNNCGDKEEYQEVCKYSDDLLRLIFGGNIEEDR